VKRAILVASLLGPLLAAGIASGASREAGRPLGEAMAVVVPQEGHHSRIALADSIVRLVDAGVIDAQKIESLYAPRGGVPPEMKALLSAPSHQPILLTRENATLYVTLLWPVGLANRLAANRDSPLNGPQLPGFASTGGWTLGKAPNGAAYFNRFALVELSEAQEAMVVRIARQAFRPCCNNSAFFQDCNHGSALLGLLALGARQGLGEDQLLREALAFNAFWFPHQYAHTALYFASARNTPWREVDAAEVLNAPLSSASGWARNVAAELQRRGLVPQGGDASCGI
jgi:hypothetical protein